jgi:hypothetical protein
MFDEREENPELLFENNVYSRAFLSQISMK